MEENIKTEDNSIYPNYSESSDKENLDKENTEKENAENENAEKEKRDSINIRLILDAVCGETGIITHPAKCLSIVANSTFRKGDITDEDISCEQSDTAVITIQRRGQFIYVCMDFKNKGERDFNSFLKLFEEYGEFQEKLADIEDIFVANTLTFIPNAFPQFNIIAVNPLIWYMQPDNSKSVEMTQIMALYPCDNVSFNVNNIDDAKIEEEIVDMYNRQIERENLEMVEMEKEIKRLSDELVLKKATENDDDEEI